ncbi:SOS response-associated peptidase [Mycetocola saprophilus]|uniref:SOS response-associated peptidase n=1 Tax=Mycetocola saprophilus TaxID=76636 RepID=UPI0009DD0F6B|nr:SOS response-associated peptidase [Mycetocola saprophilus]
MCGRFAMDGEINNMIVEFIEETGRAPAEWRPSWQPSWNIAPTQQIPILLEATRPELNRELRFEGASWSLVPRWSETLRPKFPTFNARIETAAEKPTFKTAVRHQRAVVFATGYYEWHTEDGVKVPYFIRPATHEITAFAGLYSWWPDPALPESDPARWHLTATILTQPTAPNLAEIHDRNPVFLPQELWLPWIDSSVTGDAALLGTVAEAGSAWAREFRVDRVGPVRGNGPELIDPLAA